MSVQAIVGKVEVVKFTYKWIINNKSLSSCKEVADKLESPLFTTEGGTKLEWLLWLYPRSKEDKDFMSVYLISHHNKSSLAAQFSIHVFSKTKEISKFEYASQKLTFHCDKGFGQHRFLKRSLIIDEANDVLTDDNLTVVCEIFIDFINAKNLEQNSDRKLKELDRLEELVDDEKYSHVTLIVNGTKFHAHKNILATKSPVFAAMFEHPMKEKLNSEVEIGGIDQKVFKEMLRFMYVTKVDDIENIADRLLVAADRYSLEALKTMCEETLIANLSRENAVEYLRIADLHNVPNLKNQIIEFIVSNAKELVNVSEYESIVGLPPNVVFEVICAISTQKNKRGDK